jgi:DNA-3-methyladenine glycosylase I
VGDLRRPGRLATSSEPRPTAASGVCTLTVVSGVTYHGALLSGRTRTGIRITVVGLLGALRNRNGSVSRCFGSADLGCSKGDAESRLGQTRGFEMAARKTASSTGKVRCWWCGDDPLMIAYHDREWGVPVHDDRVLFEFLTLEGAQAGLSWLTVLRKREAYRAAFADFDVQKVARFTSQRLERLMQNPGIVRNRLKLQSAVKNARAFASVQEEFGSFAAYQWRFVDGVPLQNAVRSRADIPARSAVSDAFSKDLVKRGFSFVGSTIMYAHMQAVGMVNDHWLECFRSAKLAPKPRKPSATR